MPSGDSDFLKLLDAIRAVLPKGKLLSIAAYPPPTRWHPFPEVHWEQNYFREVAKRCDQVAVMDAGVIVEQGSVADVFLHPKHPTTKRFVQESEQIDESEQRDDFAHVPGRIVRLTFQGEATYAPLLGTVARETGVDYSILAGRIDRIKDIPYGQLTLAVTGGDMEAAFARFTAADVHMEVLR
jgi:D-methionine transport system ATP-binding protein